MQGNNQGVQCRRACESCAVHQDELAPNGMEPSGSRPDGTSAGVLLERRRHVGAGAGAEKGIVDGSRGRG